MEEFGEGQDETEQQSTVGVFDLDEDDTALAQFGIVRQAV
jgi:hypothetical protein